MDTLSRILVRYGALVRLAWAVVALLLVACNNPNDGGGNPGY